MGATVGDFIESILMHDPIRFLTMGGSTLVKHKGFSHSYSFGAAVNHLITTGGFPKSGSGGAVGSGSGRVLLVFVAKEVPVILWGGSDFAPFCAKFDQFI